MNVLNRKNFLQTIATASGVLVLPGILFSQQQSNQQKAPPLDPALVKEFVGAAHKDFSKVKSMLDETPDLLNAVNNLGGWDWEDALGAAGHVGIPDEAYYLLEKGGRMTICVAAMLGKISIVRPMIEEFPYLKNAVGPHKISLLRHAKAGGENALEVVDYLKTLGVKE
jgi:hypothetical protein